MNKKHIILSSVSGFVIGIVLTGIIFVYALPEHVGDLKEMENISKETGYSIIKNPEGPTNYLVISPVNQKDETIMAGLMINNMVQINNLENEDIARKITFRTLFGYMLATNIVMDNLIQNSENPKLVKNMNKEDMEIIEQFKELSPILFKTYNLLHEEYK